MRLGVRGKTGSIGGVWRKTGLPGLPQSPPEFLAIASLVPELVSLILEVCILVLEFLVRLLELEDNSLEIGDWKRERTAVQVSTV